MESWHLEGCLPLVAPLTCGNDRTLKDHISKYQCICLSLLVIIPHHLSISFLVFAAPIDCVHDYWLQSNGHPHIHILWLSSKRSIFTLIASQATESNRIQSKSILQRSQNQAVAAMQLLGKKHLIQLMLSCCCGKSLFLLHVF